MNPVGACSALFSGTSPASEHVGKSARCTRPPSSAGDKHFVPFAKPFDDHKNTLLNDDKQPSSQIDSPTWPPKLPTELSRRETMRPAQIPATREKGFHHLSATVARDDHAAFAVALADRSQTNNDYLLSRWYSQSMNAEGFQMVTGSYHPSTQRTSYSGSGNAGNEGSADRRD